MTKDEDDDYFDLIQEEILLKRKQLQKLINQPTLLGTYYEELIRDTLVKFIPKKYTIANGIITGPKGNSKQLDILIYDNTISFPLFAANNMIILRPDYAMLVIEIKSEITTHTIEQAVNTLRSAINVYNSYQDESSPFQTKMPTMIIGFASNRSLPKCKELCKLHGIDEIFFFSKRDGTIVKGEFLLLIQKILYYLEPRHQLLHYREKLKKDGYIQE